MTEQTAGNAADSGALSLDQFVGALDKDAEAANAETEEEIERQGDGETEVEAEAEAVEEDETEIEAEAEEEEEPEPEPEPEPKLPAPQSWAKEDRAAWDALPAAAQAVIAKREADRDRAVSEAATKAGRAAAEVQALAQNYEQVKNNVYGELEREAETWSKRWGNVDWQRLADDRPKDYISYKAQADAEREQVFATKARLDKVAADAKKASDLARTAFLAEQSDLLMTLSPELTDPEKGPARRAKVAEFLLKQGFSEDVLAEISAPELAISYDAMRWRDAQEAAKKQASLPRKNPTSTAKPTPTGGGQAVASPQRTLQAASQKLTKTGRLDDFVNLLNAEEEHRSRKARAK